MNRLTAIALPTVTLHAASRMIRRDVPVEAIDLVKQVVPILTDKPLTVKFRKAGIAFVACLSDDGVPCIISAWRFDVLTTATKPHQIKLH
jgi:hypothetical protein